MNRNYLNYIGSKDRYLPQIMKHIARSDQRGKFIDLFWGSAIVGINAAPLFHWTYCNDACESLIKIHEWVKNAESYEKLLGQVNTIINDFSLSKTNKEGYLKLRELYNTLKVYMGTDRPDLLYCLINHSYNYSLQMN